MKSQDLEPPLHRLITNIEKAYQGKRETIEYIVVALLCQGHILLEDVPGVGKTTLAKALAKSIQGKFSRIQFTPDLLPADILGLSLYSPKTESFVFHPGPIFANVVLADELNRTSARTQAALLEAMNEKQVTVDGKTHPLPQPFFVLATQNPTSFEGTYHLPESQLDRFFFKLQLGYPPPEKEKKILTREEQDPVALLSSSTTLEEILEHQKKVQKIQIDEDLFDYLLSLTQATRQVSGFLGISPRGALALKQASQALAYLRGRNFVIPEDIRELVFPCWEHRLIPQGYTKATSKEVLEEILSQIPCPK